MKPNSTYAFIRHFLALILFLSCQFIAAQECTIDFSNLTIDTPDGTITVGDNATVCINQTVNLPNLAFQAGSDQTNPGIIWAVYDCQPTTIAPDDDPCKRPVVLRDPDGDVIIGGGEADFSFANLPTPGESEITVCLVPIIDGDVSGLAIEDDCTGIAVGVDYPCITFLVPEDNPTQCESDCDDFEVNDECVDAIGLTLQAGTVVFPTEADSAYSNICATRENDLDAPTCSPEGIANTVWFSFEGTGGEYTISVNACEAATDLLISDSQMAIYTGGCDGLTEVACNDDIGGSNLLSSITEFATEAGVTYHIMVDGLDNESGEFCIEVTETAPPCDADFGTVNFEGETTTCEGSSLSFALIGDNTEGFTSGFVVVDDMGVIVNILDAGDLNLAPGIYTIVAINYDDNDADAVNGATTLEELNGLEICADIEVGGTSIIVLSDGTLACCEATIDSVTAVEEIVVCQIEGESLDFNVNGANTGENYSNVWYFEQNGVMTLGGVFPANVNPLTFNPNILGVQPGTVSIFVVNVGTVDVQVVINAIEAGEDIPALVAGPAICSAIVDEPLIITILPAESPECSACEPNAGNSSANAESICEGECIAVTVTGDNQDEGFSTVVLITSSDEEPIIDAISAGDFCLDAGTYTLYSFNLFTTLLPELTAQLDGGASVLDLQALIAGGTFCGAIEGEGTTITFLPPNDDACFECDASVGTLVNPAEDVTICFGDELTFEVEGDNINAGFNTQILGVSPDDNTIDIFIEDDVTQVLEVGTYQYYAINFAEDEEPTLNDIIANGTFADLVALIDDNGFCAELTATFVTVTVLPADHPSCVGDPFEVDFTITVAPDGLTYTVTITMSGGSGDYTIDGIEVEGNTFTSEPIPCGEPFSFEASDGTFIEIVEGTSPCPEPCFADAGIMPSTDAVNPICAGDVTLFNTTGSNLGDDDVLIYVLHDSATTELGTVLAVNINAGTFDPLSGENILTNTVYYISAVVGPDDDNDGIPDSNNECTVVALGTPVVFLEPLELLFDINCDEQTGDAMVFATVSGGYPAFDSNGTYSVSGSFNVELQLPTNSFSFNAADGDMISFDLTDGFCLIQSETKEVVCTKNPIELLSFEGEVLTDGNLLQWLTATEIDNDYFTLERSIDGKNFEAIAVVQSQGNSVNVQAYDFMDRTAPSGVSYYQLRQTDFNGQQTVSHTISLQRGERGFELVNVFPNPAKNEVHINFTISEERMVEISVYNIEGRELENLKVEGKKGINQTTINVSHYPTGVYFMQIFDGSTIHTQKIVKE